MLEKTQREERMAFKDENVVLARIDEIEAVVNGLIFYLSSKESGLELDLDDPKVKDFLRANVTRPFDSRLVFSQAIGAPRTQRPRRLFRS